MFIRVLVSRLVPLNFKNINILRYRSCQQVQSFSDLQKRFNYFPFQLLVRLQRYPLDREARPAGVLQRQEPEQNAGNLFVLSQLHDRHLPPQPHRISDQVRFDLNPKKQIFGV